MCFLDVYIHILLSYVIFTYNESPAWLVEIYHDAGSFQKTLEYFLHAEDAVVVSSAEQTELKQKLYCLYFYNQLF